MCFFFSSLPATGWLIVGFFVLFAAAKAEGRLASFGRILGAWALVVALMFPVVGAYLTLSGNCPMATMMEPMHPEPSH